MNESLPTRLGWLTLCAVLLVGCSGYHSQADAPGYQIEIIATEIRLVDGLAWHPSGALLATEEYRGGGVVRIDPESGGYTYVIRDLADPDNILVRDGEIYLTEEDAQGRIVRIDRLGQKHVFADGLDGPEGLDLGPDDKLYVAEHVPSGHVFRFSLDGARETVGSVVDGEGLRVLPDGTVVVAETSLNRVVAFDTDGEKRVFAEHIKAADGIAYDPTRARVLVTEDAAPGRMMAVDVQSGNVEVVASGLHSPQTMLVEADGAIVLAEQGEDRILRLRPSLEEP